MTAFTFGSVYVLEKYVSNLCHRKSGSGLRSASVLLQFSEGYSPLEIERAVNETLTMKRLHRFKPVSNMEFLMALTLDEESLPLDQDDVEAWTRWYASTPLMRKRREMLEQERAAEELLGAT